MEQAPKQVQDYLGEEDISDLIDMYWEALSLTKRAELLKEIEELDDENPS